MTRRPPSKWSSTRRPLAQEVVGELGEALSARWLGVEEIRQQMDPAYVVRVTDAFAEGAPARVHDGVDLVHA